MNSARHPTRSDNSPRFVPACLLLALVGCGGCGGSDGGTSVPTGGSPGGPVAPAENDPENDPEGDVAGEIAGDVAGTGDSELSVGASDGGELVAAGEIPGKGLRAGQPGNGDAPQGSPAANGPAGHPGGHPMGSPEDKALAEAYAAAAVHLEAPLDLAPLEAELTAIPDEVTPTLDPSLIQPGDPQDFPAATHIGGVPVRILRERHPSTNVLLRIATVRATAADTESADLEEAVEGAGSASSTRPILHGPEWLYHDSGALRSTLWWSQDVKHGPIKQWRPVGTCVFEGRFKNGQRDGLRREYSKAGKLLELQVYADGNPHGPYRAWYAKGGTKEEAYFVRGRYEGPRKGWGRSGLLVLSENYKNGERDGRWSDFDPDAGTPRSWGTFAAGKRVGVWQTGSPEGVLLESHEYKDGVMHGEARVWAPNGELIERSEYQSGRQTGPSFTWYASGKPQSEGELVDGARTGSWTYWREDGSVNDTWSGVYENDLRVEAGAGVPPAKAPK